MLLNQFTLVSGGIGEREIFSWTTCQNFEKISTLTLPAKFGFPRTLRRLGNIKLYNLSVCNYDIFYIFWQQSLRPIIHNAGFLNFRIHFLVFGFFTSFLQYYPWFKIHEDDKKWCENLKTHAKYM